MASRLVPLLIAAGAAAAIGCGGSNANAPRTGAAARASDWRSFAAPVRKSDATVWATGDSAGGANASAVGNLIRRSHADKALYLGTRSSRPAGA